MSFANGVGQVLPSSLEYQETAGRCRYSTHGSAIVRGVHFLDALSAGRQQSRKRGRSVQTRLRGTNYSIHNEAKPPISSETYRDRKLLIVLESEGAVFNSLELEMRRGYIPAFASLFSWAEVDAEYCNKSFERIALRSRSRGDSPLLLLLATLRYINLSYPSVRRTAIIRQLESMLSKDPQPIQEIHAEDSSQRPRSPRALIEEWLELSNSLLSQGEGSLAECFPRARSFLESLSSLYPESQVLVYSAIPEAHALNRWEVAGLGNCFMRIAGPERGDFRAYLRTALQNGYDRLPILVVGTSNTAMRAAQDVGARFYPIIPGFEDSSWEELSLEVFPAFVQGRLAFLQGNAYDFLGMLNGFSDLGH